MQCSVNMRDLANKMAEIKFEAPLAHFEDSDEGWSVPEYHNQLNNNNNNTPVKTTASSKSEMEKDEVMNMLNSGTVPGNRSSVETFNEMTSGSLEDLVNTFDEKITKCFGNYEQSVEELAPVQMRTQEEIMSECQ